MSRRDAIAVFLAACAAALLWASALTCLRARPPALVRADGGAWAAAGCIDPATATARDWRIIPGVTRRVADGLRAINCVLPIGPAIE